MSLGGGGLCVTYSVVASSAFFSSGGVTAVSPKGPPCSSTSANGHVLDFVDSGGHIAGVRWGGHFAGDQAHELTVGAGWTGWQPCLCSQMR